MDINKAYDELPKRPRKPDNERLYPFTLCLTPDDRKRLRAVAKAQGLTPATFARLAIQKLMKEHGS
jgi:hypothetical protein